VLSVKSPQFSNCPYAKCHFIDPSLTGFVLQSQPSLSLSATTNLSLLCSGKGTKRTLFSKTTFSLLMRHTTRSSRTVEPVVLAYILKSQGVHVTTAQKLLGHSDVKVTLKVYTQVLDDEIDAAGDLLRLIS